MLTVTILLAPLFAIGLSICLAALFLSRNKRPQLNVVALPITCCPECWADYDLEEFKELPFIERKDEKESRLCSCQEILTINPDEFEQDYMLAQDYQALWPESLRTKTRIFVFDEKKGVQRV